MNCPPRSLILSRSAHADTTWYHDAYGSELRVVAMIHISEQSAALLQALEGAAQVGDRQAFVSQAEAIDWAAQTPDDLAHAIDLALRLELGTLAIALAQQAGQLFPDHVRLRQAA